MQWKSYYDYVKQQEHEAAQERQQHEYHNNLINNQYHQQVDAFYANSPVEFHDPWEDYYRKQEQEAELELQRKREEEDQRHIISSEPREGINSNNNNNSQQQHYSPDHNQSVHHNYHFTPERSQEFMADDHNCNSQYFTTEPVFIGGEQEHSREGDAYDHSSHMNTHEPEHYSDHREEVYHTETPASNPTAVTDHNDNEECDCRSTKEAENTTQSLSNYDSSEKNRLQIDIVSKNVNDNSGDRRFLFSPSRRVVGSPKSPLFAGRSSPRSPLFSAIRNSPKSPSLSATRSSPTLTTSRSPPPMPAVGSSTKSPSRSAPQSPRSVSSDTDSHSSGKEVKKTAPSKYTIMKYIHINSSLVMYCKNL